MKVIVDFWKVLKRSTTEIFEFYLFALDTFRRLLTFSRQKQIGFTVLLRQIMFTGYEALPLISFLALSIGGLIIIQGYNILGTFGQGDLIYVILVTVVIRELSSILTALIVIARSGTAISTELGNMVTNNEINLLLSCGISPVSYLVVSRMVGVVVALFTLTIYFNLAAVFGGWLFSALFSPINFRYFFSQLFSQMTMADILIGVLKSILFGIGIALISSYQGLKVNIASTEVPQRTIRAVVLSIVFVVFADIIITALFYLI
ncbi:MAG: ABC transporter permease [Candidatus Cloacimonetes bacterium]|nr:ABC transporter permease [Candidatus Cloacimonadota bacterium]